MKFSLRVICNRSIVEIINQQVAELTNYLNLSDDYAFLPYWKDEECVILDFGAEIENHNYSKIKQYIKYISGADNIPRCSLPNYWECTYLGSWQFAYFASYDELHSNQNVAFVDCCIDG